MNHNNYNIFIFFFSFSDKGYIIGIRNIVVFN